MTSKILSTIAACLFFLAGYAQTEIELVTAAHDSLALARYYKNTTSLHALLDNKSQAYFTKIAGMVATADKATLQQAPFMDQYLVLATRTFMIGTNATGSISPDDVAMLVVYYGMDKYGSGTLQYGGEPDSIVVNGNQAKAYMAMAYVTDPVLIRYFRKENGQWKWDYASQLDAQNAAGEAEVKKYQGDRERLLATEIEIIYMIKTFPQGAWNPRT